MFPDFPLAPLTFIDVALTLALAFGLPLYLFVEHRREKRREAAGRGPTRLQRYRGAIAVILTIGAATLAAWSLSGREFSELGFTAEVNALALSVASVVLVACGLLLAQAVVVSRSAKARADVVRQLEGQAAIDKFVPRTRAEFRMFALASLVAGVFEEIVFRGFLIWALAHWMPVWAAASASVVVFTLSHLYQETAGALLRVLGVAVVLTLVVVFSGSLYPAIVLHIAIDLSSGYVTWRARREEALPHPA